MAVEQHAELVDAVDDVVLRQDVPGLLRLPLRARHLVQREHGVVAGVIGVVAGRPVDHLAALAHREVVGDRDRLVVGHQEAVLGLRRGRPRAHPRAGARPLEVDRGVAAEVVAGAARRQRLFMRAPAELGRLHALRDEAFDRPGVDELARRLGVARALGVALGDVDALDAGALHQARPNPRAICGSTKSSLSSPAMSTQRLLDHPGHHAGIGAAAAHGGDAAGAPPAQIEHALAQRIVRALRDRAVAVGVEARPRLDDGVDVEGVEVLARAPSGRPRRCRPTGSRHAAARPRGEQRGEHLAIILLGQRLVDELDLALVQQAAIAVVRAR